MSPWQFRTILSDKKAVYTGKIVAEQFLNVLEQPNSIDRMIILKRLLDSILDFEFSEEQEVNIYTSCLIFKEFKNELDKQIAKLTTKEDQV